MELRVSAAASTCMPTSRAVTVTGCITTAAHVLHQTGSSSLRYVHLLADVDIVI